MCLLNKVDEKATFQSGSKTPIGSICPKKAANFEAEAEEQAKEKWSTLWYYLTRHIAHQQVGSSVTVLEYSQANKYHQLILTLQNAHLSLTCNDAIPDYSIFIFLMTNVTFRFQKLLVGHQRFLGLNIVENFSHPLLHSNLRNLDEKELVIAQELRPS